LAPGGKAYDKNARRTVTYITMPIISLMHAHQRAILIGGVYV
jgi:hypothetical protein